MKKIIILAIVIGLLGVVGFTMAAKDGPNGRPFQAIWNFINNVDSNSQCSSECPEGPEGSQGPKGPKGDPGESNWDEERIAELEERVAVLEARECLPESVRAVETGLPGICSAGTQTCGDDWMWGDVVPDNQSVEVCDDEIDNDCDGDIDKVDEDCEI